MNEDIEHAGGVPSGFPQPERSRRPESVAGLKQVWGELHRASGPEPIAVGGREHLRADRISAPWCAVETTECDEVVSVDRESGLARVEAGIRWGDLRRRLQARNLGVEQIGLHPASATVGGLLGRHQPFEPQFERGDLRQACVGLTTSGSQKGSVYGYRTAPRKASGPDLRYVAIGGEGRQELILEATLVVTVPPDITLIEIPADDATHAFTAWRRLNAIGVRMGWAWWRRSEGTLWATAYGPDRYLRAAKRRLGETSLNVAFDGPEAARQRRSALEAQHPDRRILDRRRPVWKLDFPVAELESAMSDHPGADAVISDWGPHRVAVWITGLEGEPSGELRHRALGGRRVSDGRLLRDTGGLNGGTNA